jgi:hypothetical protein
MSVPTWSGDPGALLDAYVSSTDADDWQSAVDGVRAIGWPSSYSEDGASMSMPSDVSEIFARSQFASCLWTIRPTNEIAINCHFFGPDEIEFDLDPREIQVQRHLDLVCQFISGVRSS